MRVENCDADLLGQLRGDLAAEEGGDLLGLDAQHRLAGQLLVERPQRGGGAEHQVGGIFDLHQAPVIGLPEHVEHRAALRGITVEHAVQLIGRKDVGQVLGALPVVDADEGIVGRGEADAFGRQLARQPAMAVAVELQAERRPGGHPQIDQPQLGIHEVEIVVQALAAVRPQIGLVRLLVVPRAGRRCRLPSPR